MVDGPTQLRHYRDLYDAYDYPHPVFELAFKWLEPRLAGATRQTLVHGDFRNGNLIISPEGLEAVLDWELTHIGDPLEDIGWICTNSWRFGVADKVVGGFGDLEELIAGYRGCRRRRDRPRTGEKLDRVWLAQMGRDVHDHVSGLPQPIIPSSARRSGGAPRKPKSISSTSSCMERSEP